MEDQGKENNFSFEQIELAFYEEHYGNYVMKQNERHVKARHPDRCKEVEDVWKNKKTCPEESIYQLGTIDEHASVETLILVFDEFKKEFDERFGSNVHIIDWSLHMDEATPHIHERHVFDATNRYGEIEPKQETALEELGFELPDPEKKRSKTNNRKVVFDSACRTIFLDICKRHGLELDEEPSYGGRKYLEKQDYIRMKQKEEIANQQKTILMQIDKVNENRLELAKQSRYVRANEEIIQSQEEKIKQQDTEFANNSDRIFKQGDLIEEQREELQQLTVRIEDVEVKQNVTVRQAVELYGLKPNRSGLIRCIFHNDKSPSMKVDRRYYCFGCGCTGDAIDFTAQLFGIGLKDAAMKLADDFRIPYSGKDRESQQNKRRVPIKKPKPTPEELWQKKYLRCMRAYLDYRSLLLEWKEQYAPKTWTEEWNEKFMTSLSELTVVEYYLDILLFGDRADKEVLVKEKWKEMEKIEQCEREDKGDCYKRTERCHERNAPDGR